MAHISKRQQKKQKSKIATTARLSKFTQIVMDQGSLCFFCGESMGYDCTREHLLARVLGGDNSRANLRAAHGECNSAAGHLPISDKLRLRSVGLSDGRAAMLLMAKQMRRADARVAFEEKDDPDLGELLTAPLGRVVTMPTDPVKEKSPRKPRKGERARVLKYMGQTYHPSLELDDSSPDPKTYRSH